MNMNRCASISCAGKDKYMYTKKDFGSAIEAIRYVKEQGISFDRLVYIARKKGSCELVFRNEC